MMKPVEMQVLATSHREHLDRERITDFLALADLTPDVRADHVEFRRLHEAWLVSRDAQRLAQTQYAAHLASVGVRA